MHMLMDVIRMEERRSFGLFMTEIKQCADIVMGCALVFTEPALSFDFMLQSNQPLYCYIFFSLRKNSSEMISSYSDSGEDGAVTRLGITELVNRVRAGLVPVTFTLCSI